MLSKIFLSILLVSVIFSANTVNTMTSEESINYIDSPERIVLYKKNNYKIKYYPNYKSIVARWSSNRYSDRKVIITVKKDLNNNSFKTLAEIAYLVKTYCDLNNYYLFEESVVKPKSSIVAMLKKEISEFEKLLFE